MGSFPSIAFPHAYVNFLVVSWKAGKITTIESSEGRGKRNFHRSGIQRKPQGANQSNPVKLASLLSKDASYEVAMFVFPLNRDGGGSDGGISGSIVTLARV